MLLIPCPYCGARNVSEFSYAGDAAATRPAEPAALSVRDWADWVYLRDNPRGPHRELWQHSAGCRRYIVVERDTLTHEITAARAPGGASG